MSDVAQWLERLGLGQYAQVFAENDVDFEVLPCLTDDNLKELGLKVRPETSGRIAEFSEHEAD